MLGSYLKLAFKVLLRRKFFTFVSLFGIVFTLITLMVAVAMLDHGLSAMAPEVNLDRTLHVARARMTGEHYNVMGSPGYALLDKTVRDLPGVEELSLLSNHNSVVSFVDGQKIVSRLTRTDGAYWKILQFHFLEGGPFTELDEQQANMVAVISAATRERFFAGAPAAGRSIEAGGQTFQVVGVVDNVPRYREPASADIWVPLSTNKNDDYRRRMIGGHQALLLLGDEALAADVKAELRSRVSRLELDEGFSEAVAPALTRLETMSMGYAQGIPEEPPTARMILLNVGLALLFMLLPAINLININISRIFERASEIGVRKAFGASSTQLVAQFVLENVLLCAIGGLIAFVGSIGLLAAVNASGLIPWSNFGVNLRVFLAALAIACFFGVLSGVYPAWRMSRLHPVRALKEGGA
jgi:putative ABC transport system permease protein